MWHPIAVLAVAEGFVALYAAACVAQRHCRRRLAWHRRTAGWYKADADQCRRKAVSNASLAETVTGERAREWHRRRAARLPRDAERCEAHATRHEGRARLWDFLQ